MIRAKKPKGKKFEEVERVYGNSIKFPDGQLFRECDVIFKVDIKVINTL